MTEVNLIVKVVDRITDEAKKIVGRFRDLMKRAATSVGSFFSNFSAQSFKDVFGGLKKIGEAVAWVGNKFNEFAPDAKKFTATFSDDQLAKLQKGAESFNRLGAAWDKFVGTLLASGGILERIFNNIAQRLSQITSGPALTKVGEAGVEVLKKTRELEEAQRLFDEYRQRNPNLTETRAQKSSYGERIKEAQASLEASKKALAAAEKEAAQERKLLEEYKAQNAALVEQTRLEEEMAKAKKDYEASRAQDAKWFDDFARRTNEQKTDYVTKDEEFWKSLEEHSAAFAESQKRQLERTIDLYNEQFEANNERREQDQKAHLARLEEQRVAAQQAEEARKNLEVEAYRKNMEAIEALDRERIEKAQAEVAKMKESLDRVAQIMTDRIMAAFDSIIQGTDNVGRAFTRMIGGIIADVGRMMAAEAMKNFILSILGGLSASATSATNEAGDVIRYSPMSRPIQGRASGGFVAERNALMVGERGPEMFVPPSSGNIITAARAGGNSVSGVTINVNGAQDPGRTAREVKAALMSLMSSDPAARQRLRVVASGGGVA